MTNTQHPNEYMRVLETQRSAAAPPEPTLVGVSDEKRASNLREQLATVRDKIAQAKARENELIEHIPDEADKAGHAGRLSVASAEIRELEQQADGLAEQIYRASRIDQADANAKVELDFEMVIRQAKERAAVMPAIAARVEDVVAVLGALLGELETARKETLEILDRAKPYLPRRQRLDQVHAMHRALRFGRTAAAFSHRLMDAGLGRAGLLADVAFNVTQDQRYPGPLAEIAQSDYERIAAHMDHWGKLARGDKPRIQKPIGPPPAPNPPHLLADHVIKWAHVDHFGAGGQRPGWTPPEK